MTSTPGCKPDLTDDAFLGGAVSILQPRRGFRSGIDAVLLAASVPAKSGQTALELGSGVGVASLCLMHRVPGLAVTAVEAQGGYADLCARNARRNGHALEVCHARLEALPEDLRQRNFDHVFANPPYFAPSSRTRAQDAGRETALEEDTPLDLWVEVARRRLKPKGILTMIHLASRLPDLLGALGSGFGGVTVLPLAPRPGKDPNLVLLRARQSARAPFRLLTPCILHHSPRHAGDHESYSSQINDVLRKGAAMPFGPPPG